MGIWQRSLNISVEVELVPGLGSLDFGFCLVVEDTQWTREPIQIVSWPWLAGNIVSDGCSRVY